MGVTMQPWFYQLRDVHKQYVGHSVVQIERLEILMGEVLCLVGPTGAGKSTLLRLLAGLEAPSQGMLLFGRQQLPTARLPRAAQRQISMVFQRPLLLRGTVKMNIEYGLRLRGSRASPAKVQEVIERLGLLEIVHQYAHTLSGGQTQLVALARALAIEPDVLLLDEPTAHLDPARVGLVEQAIRDYRQRRQATIVWATHNLFQARRVAHRVALLLDGQLVEVAPTTRFFEAPADPRTTAFVQGKMIY
jgi:tungstate transport system ATP-binding protein